MTQFLSAIILGLFVTFSAHAGDFGLGLIIGAPTGISGKYLVDQGHAIDGALAWDLGDNPDVHIHGDYLWQKNRALRLDNVALDWFFGVGGRMIFHQYKNKTRDDKDFHLGVRGPIGIGYTFRDPRIEVFGELALIMNLVQSTSVDIDGGIGARYYF